MASLRSWWRDATPRSARASGEPLDPPAVGAADGEATSLGFATVERHLGEGGVRAFEVLAEGEVVGGQEQEVERALAGDVNEKGAEAVEHVGAELVEHHRGEDAQGGVRWRRLGFAWKQLEHIAREQTRRIGD